MAEIKLSYCDAAERIKVRVSEATRFGKPIWQVWINYNPVFCDGLIGEDASQIAARLKAHDNLLEQSRQIRAAAEMPGIVTLRGGTSIKLKQVADKLLDLAQHMQFAIEVDTPPSP